MVAKSAKGAAVTRAKPVTLAAVSCLEEARPL
jgi:hypothetical protein